MTAAAVKLVSRPLACGLMRIFWEVEGRYSLSIAGQVVAEADTIFGIEQEAGPWLRGEKELAGQRVVTVGARQH